MNALAIYLVEDHPGNQHVSRAVDRGLGGRFRLFVADHAPFRARWILTTSWKVPKPEADAAIRDFVEHPRVTIVGATRETLLRAFDLASSLGHDPYDTYLLALAVEHGIGGILTTDRDFKTLAPRVGLDYDNPVPASVLARFASHGR